MLLKLKQQDAEIVQRFNESDLELNYKMADLERKSQGYVNSQLAKSVKGSQAD